MSSPRVLVIMLAVLSLLPGLGLCQTAEIVSGNGQLVLFGPTVEPMVALIRDAAGKPLANWPVQWSKTSGTGGVLNCPEGSGADVITATTDANGRTSCGFTGLSIPGQAYAQTTIAVQALSSVGGQVAGTGVTFTMTTVGVDLQTGVQLVQPALEFPTPDTLLVGQAGTVGNEAIQVRVGTYFTAVPNVAVRLIPQDPGAITTPPTAPSIQCANPGGVAYTDATGLATCRPLFGGKPGTGKYTIAVGGQYQLWEGQNFQVTAGPPATIRILQGDNQPGGLPGQQLTGTLLAQVEDAAGNPLPNVPIKWEVIPPAAGTVTNQSTASDMLGKVSARVNLGSVPGPAQVRVFVEANPAVQNYFNFTVNLVVSGLRKVLGDNQDAPLGQQFAQPLTVEVNSPNGPVASAPVAFTLVSGDAVILTPNATANAQGQASTLVRAGNTAGPVVIRAETAGQSATFNLTVRLPGPGLTSDSFYAHPFFIQGGANRGRLAPGSIATIVAPGIAPGINGYVVPTNLVGPLPYELGGVTVEFAGLKAPIYHVANLASGGVSMQFVTVQVPFEVTPGAVPVTVSIRSGGSATQTVQILPSAPAIFESIMEDGVLRGVVVRENGSYVSLTNLPGKGEIVRMYVTGLGQGSPAIHTGQPGQGEEVPLPVVGVGNEGVRVISARYLPGAVGVYEVEFEIPTNAASNWNSPLAVLTFVNDQRVDSNPSKIPIQ
ncbi:MAG: hypothetical protein IT158_25195 [Bryobacterales bacterium]|nr:hypothetical protein [Bryobacterales bacterium]